MNNQLVGVIWIFGWVGFIILVWHLRWKRRQHLLQLIHQERMLALEKGLPVPELPDLESHTSERTKQLLRVLAPNPKWPLALASLSITGGAGFLAAFLMRNESDWPFALIPMFIGIGFIAQYFIMRPNPGTK